MKIYALNLCIEFTLKSSGQSYEFLRISLSDLMKKELSNPENKQAQFYVEGNAEADFINNIFALSTNEAWRQSHHCISLIFKNEAELQEAWKGMSDLFSVKKAAGGLVINEKGEYLCIYDRGRWSLPKGHVEKGEAIPVAALREVREETSLQEVEIIDEIKPTFHTYYHKRKWVLKITYWFRMSASSEQKLIPQAEENIEAVQWWSKADWIAQQPPTYPQLTTMFEQEFIGMKNGEFDAI